MSSKSRLIIGGSHRAKVLADLVVAKSGDKLRFNDPRVAALLAYFLAEPLEVFERAVICGQKIGGPLQGQRAELGEPAHDFGAEVLRLGRDAMDEK